MKTSIKILAGILLFLFLPGGGMTASAADIHEYIFNVGQFDRLAVLDDVNVIYKNVPDSTGYVVYHGERDFCDAFILTNSRGKLKIQVTTEDVGKPGLPTIYVYSDFLNEAENSGDFTVKIEHPAPCPRFKAKVVGNGTLIIDNLTATTIDANITAGMGKIVLSGIAPNAKYRIMGTGSIIADRLKCQTVECKLALGTGYIGCWATDLLKVNGLGSTKIYYKGDPTVKKSGNGKIFRLPEAPASLEEEDNEALDDADDDESESEESDDFDIIF